MSEGPGTDKLKKEDLKLPQKPASTDTPFSDDQINELADLISGDSFPDEDTGKFRIPGLEE